MESISFVFADRATVPGFLGLDVQQQVMSHLLEMKADKLLIITDENVDALHADYFAPLQKDSPRGDTGEMGSKDGQLPTIEKFVLPNGDACKSWDNLSKLVQWSFDVEASKRTVVVGFGGGAVLNVCGLFASIVFRGMKLVYVPTTFLAMHDVVTSVKTSICYDGRKNNIGSFYAPLKILIDVAFCRTLPRGELFSALGELAKNAAILGGESVDAFVEVLSKEEIDANNGGSGEEFCMDDQALLKLLRVGIKAKMGVLLKDGYEKTTGMIFEYGHTLSHAIEKAYGDGTVPHGLGVCYGMLSSSFAAEKQGIMSSKDRKKHDELCWLLLSRWPLPAPMPSAELVMERAMRDSKRGITMETDDEISDVMLRKMGDVVETKTNNLSKYPKVLAHEWLVSMGFPSSQKAVAQVNAVDCKALLGTVGNTKDRNLVEMGFEPLTVGFANRVYGTVQKGGRPLVIKRYTDLVFLRIDQDAIGAVDVHAGEHGIGPKVHHSSPMGMVQDRAPGRTLEEEDMHKGDFELLDNVAKTLADFHKLPVPTQCEGSPMLWRTVEKMMEVVERKPELIPKGMPTFLELEAEVAATRKALEKHQPAVVLGHGDCKPSNVIVSWDNSQVVKLIDFELGGPNYRGFDLMKIFRTADGPSEKCMRRFLRSYSAASGGGTSDQDVSALLDEAYMFEPLTWLEASIFFLTLPMFKPSETAKWNMLAIDRWEKFTETKRKVL